LRIPVTNRLPQSRLNRHHDNVNRERQLDEQGRAGAVAMGKAVREWKIPMGDIFSTPAYRALETAPHAIRKADSGIG
jgi:phosphohistidine phosphatase SixA